MIDFCLNGYLPTRTGIIRAESGSSPPTYAQSGNAIMAKEGDITTGNREMGQGGQVRGHQGGLNRECGKIFHNVPFRESLSTCRQRRSRAPTRRLSSDFCCAAFGLLARSDGSLWCINSVGIGGRADISRRIASANSVSLTHAIEKRSTLRREPKSHTVSSASSYRATSGKVTANESAG